MSSYTSLEARLHDLFWAEEDSPELAWMDQLLRDHPGRALEVGSGSGRLLLPLLQNGHAIEGLESSSDMIDLCRAAATDLGLDPIIHHGDMQTIRLPGTYASIHLPAFTLQLATDPAATLKNLHRHLDPDDLLYLTVFVPLAELHGELPEGEWFKDQRLKLADGSIAEVTTRFELDRAKRILKREHHYQLRSAEALQEHRSSQTIRWFPPRELSTLLEKIGFTVDNAVAEFDEDLQVDDDAQIITVMARA